MIKWFKVRQIISRAWKAIPEEVRIGLINDGYKDNYSFYTDKYLIEIDKALRLDPNSKKAIQEKFYCLQEYKKYKECIEVGQIVLEKFKKDNFLTFQSHLIIGMCYYELQDYKNALNYLNKVVSHQASRENGVESRLQNQAKEIIEKINAI